MKKIFAIFIIFSVLSVSSGAEESINSQINDLMLKAVDAVDHSGGDLHKVKQFSNNLVSDIDEQFDTSAKDECGPDYKTKGEICGYDFDPFLCAQDHQEKPKIDKITKVADGHVAEISWGSKPNSYKIIQKDKKLLIDAIICNFDDGTKIKFNWK